MSIFHILLISLTIWASFQSEARQVGNSALGRFSRNDPNYDYDSVRPEPESLAPVSPAPSSEAIEDLSEDTSSPEAFEEDSIMRAQGGIYIAGFPEGCAYANVDQPLPGHFLGFGRIIFRGSSLVLEYRSGRAAGPFSRAEVARNIGLIGQNPDQGSVDLISTPRDKYVVAQILDRSEIGLAPIVTCISPVFRGRLDVRRPLVFGQDYYADYRRFRSYRYNWGNRWNHWRTRWRDKRYDWRKPSRPSRPGRDPDKRPGIGRPKPGQGDKKPGITRPKPKPGQSDKRPSTGRPQRGDGRAQKPRAK